MLLLLLEQLEHRERYNKNKYFFFHFSYPMCIPVSGKSCSIVLSYYSPMISKHLRSVPWIFKFFLKRSVYKMSILVYMVVDNRRKFNESASLHR